jgi:hypothetical protein
MEGVAESLVKKWNMCRKRILEIGCSDGYLLNELRDKGNNCVFGYETSSQLRETCTKKGIPVSGAFFSSMTLDECPILPVHAVICRHVLEHIDDLHNFLRGVTEALVPDGIFVIEVPNVMTILARSLYSHFYHEHLSYFSLNSVRRLLGQYCFEIVEHRVVDIHGGSLFVVAKYRKRMRPFLDIDVENDETAEACEIFATNAHAYFGKLRDFVEKQCLAGVSLAGYGAAHRTVVTCSLAGLTRQHVWYLVDRNTHLHGLYTPGAYLPIYGPEKLCQDPPDAIIIFATSFESEIIREQQEFAGRGGRFISLLPEPRYLP